MTGIADHIRDEVLRQRLKRNSVLVVYDKERRYRDLCRSLASDAIAFVDASESSIESRDAAAHAFFYLREAGPAQSGPSELLIYIPAGPPLTDRDCELNPFAAYAAAGAVFPNGDGDDYLSLCLKARPDYQTEIRGLFEQDPSPPFALIDNLGGGLKWPALRTALTAESARDILFALLLPSAAQKTALDARDTWVSEARALFDTSLGLKLRTRGKTWATIADELWQFLLFSEFVFDLPGELPPALANVPRAPAPARPLVEDLCERLRSDVRTRPDYIERAAAAETVLKLPDCCKGLIDLGKRDTFPFEERVVLAAAVRAFEADKIDDIRASLEGRRGSVWTGNGESQVQWGLLQAALDLTVSCDDAQRQIDDNARSLDALVGWYASSLYKADGLQRVFEQARADAAPLDDALLAAVEHARARYRKLTAITGALFTRHLETNGWPTPRLLANADVFDRIVQPMLNDSGRRVALILVDALRYELGVALHAEVASTDPTELQAACAQLPTVTPVGMASLLPGAGAGLRLARDGDNSFAVTLGDQRLTQVGHRMDVLRTRFGDRFAEMRLSEYVNTKKNPVPETVNLLVLRSTEIDSHLESNPETLDSIHKTLKLIRVAIHNLKGREKDKDKEKVKGFDDVVIVTDHGFFLNAHAEAGDVCIKPPGNWITVHDRSLLGEGAGDVNNFAIAADKVGIRGDFPRFAGPRSIVPYSRGVSYFHGGASLQEAVVPVLTVRLRQAKPAPKTKVVLSYKDGAKRITTRLPVVSLQVQTEDLFALQANVEILLEAHDSKGNVVGEAKAGGPVNASTGTIALNPGESVQVAVRMDPDFEGKFKLKALNPETLAAYTTLDLETGYL
jgi:hypothetical protein